MADVIDLATWRRRKLPDEPEGEEPLRFAFLELPLQDRVRLLFGRFLAFRVWLDPEDGGAPVAELLVERFPFEERGRELLDYLQRLLARGRDG